MTEQDDDDDFTYFKDFRDITDVFHDAADVAPTVAEVEAKKKGSAAQVKNLKLMRRKLKLDLAAAEADDKANGKELAEMRAGTAAVAGVDEATIDAATEDGVTTVRDIDGDSNLCFLIPGTGNQFDTFAKLAKAYGKMYGLSTADIKDANALKGGESQRRLEILNIEGLRKHWETPRKSYLGPGVIVLTPLTVQEACARKKQFEDKRELQRRKGGGGARYDAGPFANAPPPDEGFAHDGTAIPPVDTTNGRTEEAEAEGEFLPYCHNQAFAPKASNTAETCAIDTYNSALGVSSFVTKAALNEAGKRNNGGALAGGGVDTNALQGPSSFNELHRHTLVLKPGTCKKSKKKNGHAASFAELLQCENKILFCSIMIDGVGKQHKHHFGVDGNRANGIGLVYDNGCNGRLIAYKRADYAGNPNDPVVEAKARQFFTDVLKMQNPQHPTAHRLMIHKNKLADAGLRYTSPY